MNPASKPTKRTSSAGKKATVSGMPAPLSQNDKRIRKLTLILECHWINPAEDSPNVDEISEYLDGRSLCGTYAIVSVAPQLNGRPCLYINADHHSFTAATDAALSRIAAADWIEVPMEIINLDTGDRWIPDFSQTPWTFANNPPRPTPEINLMKADKTETDYQPLMGVAANRLSALYSLHSEIRSHGFKSLTHSMQAYAETDFATAFNKLSRRYTAGVPSSGTRMRKLVARAAAYARDQAPSGPTVKHPD